MDPRALACVKPNMFQEMRWEKSTFLFPHCTLVKQQNQLRKYSLAIVFCQTDPKPAKAKIQVTYECWVWLLLGT